MRIKVKVLKVSKEAVIIYNILPEQLNIFIITWAD